MSTYVSLSIVSLIRILHSNSPSPPPTKNVDKRYINDRGCFSWRWMRYMRHSQHFATLLSRGTRILAPQTGGRCIKFSTTENLYFCHENGPVRCGVADWQHAARQTAQTAPYVLMTSRAQVLLPQPVQIWSPVDVVDFFRPRKVGHFDQLTVLCCFDESLNDIWFVEQDVECEFFVSIPKQVG